MRRKSGLAICTLHNRYNKREIRLGYVNVFRRFSRTQAVRRVRNAPQAFRLKEIEFYACRECARKRQVEDIAITSIMNETVRQQKRCIRKR